MEFDQIITDRLILRQLTPEVYDYVFQTYSSASLLHFFGLSTQEELDLERKKYQNGLSTYNRKFLYFQLLDKLHGNIIGWCGYHTWYIDHYRAELGYALFDDAHKGKGLMSETLVPIIKYGFEQMNLNRIEAFVGPENTASNKLLQKFHFVKEGQMRSHFFKNNQMEDSIVYSLLRSEFKK